MLNPFSESVPHEIISERYELLEQLGTDGARQTFLARDLYSPGHQTRCVVERYDLPISNKAQLQTIAQLFFADGEQLSQLGEEACVPRLLDSFLEDGLFYRVREWVEGRPLERMLSASAPLTDEQVVLLLYDLLTTVAHIHQHGILHLNLQPSTILCERQTNRLMAVSFSQFQQRCAQRLAPISGIDLPHIYELSTYMPDEQVAGEPQPGSDLYAVGMIAIRALDSYPSETPLIHPETREVQWPGFATMRHPALLAFLQGLVRPAPRDRIQTATDALEALQALPEDLTRLVTVVSVFPEAADSLYEPDTTDDETVEESQTAPQRLTKQLIPVGVGVLALAGAGGLIWRAAGPVTVADGETTDTREEISAVSSPREEPTAQSDVGDTEGVRSQPTSEVEQPFETGSAGQPGTDRVTVAQIDTGELSTNPTNLDNAEVAPLEMDQIAASVEASQANRPNWSDGRYVEPAEPVVLNTNSAKGVIQRFYDQVAARSWGDVRSLLNDSLARSLQPSFFYQFSKVTVDDFYVVNQSPDSIDFVVENTYVYLDGTSQREERSYTVEIVDNQPTITATAFEAVIKDRS